MTFAPETMWMIIKAAGTTVYLSVLSFVLGVMLAAIIAAMTMSKNRPLCGIAWLYNQVIRGTPLLMQMFFIFFALPMLGVQMSVFASALIALTLNTGAFMSEIIRASIEAIHAGQWDAAHALGLSRTQTLTKVILPQAIRIMTPSTVGYITSLIKNSSVASTIGLMEATRAGRLVTEKIGQGLVVFAFVGAVYFAICYPISRYAKKLTERGAHYDRV